MDNKHKPQPLWKGLGQILENQFFRTVTTMSEDGKFLGAVHAFSDELGEILRANPGKRVMVTFTAATVLIEGVDEVETFFAKADAMAAALTGASE